MSTATHRPAWTTAVRVRDPRTGIDWTQGFVARDVADRIADTHRANGFTVDVEWMSDQDVTHPTEVATGAELRLAAAAGRAAFAADAPAAPGIDATMRRLIGDRPIGQPRTVALFAAFSTAYRTLADRAAKEVLSA